MRVIQLRLDKGCYALKSSDNVIAKKDVTIERMMNGDYLVDEYGKLVIVPHHQVHFAVCEKDKEPVKIPVSELKK